MAQKATQNLATRFFIGWEGWQGWQQEAASSNKRKAGGYAPDDPDGPPAAASQKFAKRARVEQNLFETAASSSREYRKAAFGREEIHPPEEYLAITFPQAGLQLFGKEEWNKLEKNARNSGIEANCRHRPNRHGNDQATRLPRLVLLGPRGQALEVARRIVERATQVLGRRRMRRARRYLAAAAANKEIHYPEDFVKSEEGEEPSSAPVVADEDDSESSGDAGGTAPDDEADNSASEFEADWGDVPDEEKEDEVVGGSSSSSAVPGGASSSSATPASASASASASAPQQLPDSKARFWAACKEAGLKARAQTSALMAAVLADLDLQLESMEEDRLGWRCPLHPSPGEPRVALASHALNRDDQVKVALPLQCLAMLRMQTVGATRFGNRGM